MPNGVQMVGDNSGNVASVNSDGSINTTVVSGSVTAGIVGDVPAKPYSPPNDTDIVSGEGDIVNSTGNVTVYTVPAGRTFVGHLSLSACNGTAFAAGVPATCSVYLSGTNVSTTAWPTGGATLARLQVMPGGQSANIDTEIRVRATTNAALITLTMSAAITDFAASCFVNGVLL